MRLWIFIMTPEYGKRRRNLDFDELIDELNYDVLGNYICGSDRADVTDEFLIRGEKVLGALYEAELKKNPNRFEMPDEIYCNYHRCLFFLGKNELHGFCGGLLGLLQLYSGK